MTFAWLQKAADGSMCKLPHHCTQNMPPHKPWKVREASVPSSSTRSSKTWSQFRRNFPMIFL